MKRLDGKKIGTGLAIAAGAYLLWGLFNGSFDGSDAPSLDGADEVDAEPDFPDEMPVAPIPEPTPMPAPVEPAPAPQPVAAAPAQQVAPTPAPTAAAPTRENSGFMDWFGNLSAPSQKVLAQGFAGGAAGLMSAIAQRNAQKDAEDMRDQAREDKTRRGAIPAIGSGFIARTKGI